MVKMDDTDNEIITFSIKCTMKRRWAKQFLGMLKYMQQLGSMGSSREVSFFADGDGDYRPRFVFSKEAPEPADGTCPNDLRDDGTRHWDAG